MTDLTPRQIVHELDRFIIGQDKAKRAVAIALRNRWRRRQLDSKWRDEVHPKNILLIGPTGVGKTEISRRLAKLVHAPFIKVEATKFTEVGYVGRDVEQIIRDLVEASVAMTTKKMTEDVRDQAHSAAVERVIDALAGDTARDSTRAMYRDKVQNGELDNTEIEIKVMDTKPANPMLEIPGQPGSGIGMINLNDMIGNAFGVDKTVTRKMTVADSYPILIKEESEKLIDKTRMTETALRAVEESGIVFLDEIDKIAAHGEHRRADVSREGVQRDLLSLVEGTTVTTKHGTVQTDHILFIASGAFHIAKPSDLLPELQGRLPIRVQLRDMNKQDFVRILTETDNALTEQYRLMMATESIKISFTKDAIVELADSAVQINQSIENIGVRRLYAVLERVFEELSFNAPEQSNSTVVIDKTYIKSAIGDLLQSVDNTRYML